MNIKWLCDIAHVSRSGYYAWLEQEKRRNEREEQDRADFELILEVYQYRGYAKGSRSIYMRLLQMGIVMNRKKIQRLMNKYNLVCPIRKPNPYKRMAKARHEHATKPNHLNRQFKAHGPKTVLLTDITYLYFGRGQKAYLATIKDSFTNQILSYALSESLEVDFVLEMIEQLIEHHAIPRKQKTLIHSDQGVHYTSVQFQSLLNDKELRQSMSRRGNCWDNAPQESFFGHMKDELGNLSSVLTFASLSIKIDDYMDYYNNERYQWDLAKLSPNQYAAFIKTGVYPLAHLVKTPNLPAVAPLQD
ncbi:transposase InsO family protein [Robertmurraya andreesenii]|uniref:Transposase InsO family protein n=1 Tax=Anoxybacillus andreesenii TaxID=1325932 RepID=A0ABT9VA71_9BACL|nr:transposase InsO family protein [Robertmurraya andreesenii]